MARSPSVDVGIPKDWEVCVGRLVRARTLTTKITSLREGSNLDARTKQAFVMESLDARTHEKKHLSSSGLQSLSQSPKLYAVKVLR